MFDPFFKILNSRFSISHFWFSVLQLLNLHGKTIYLVKGYPFYLVNDNGYLTSWRCTKTTISCKARFTMAGNNIVRHNFIHNHKNDDYYIANGVYYRRNNFRKTKRREY